MQLLSLQNEKVVYSVVFDYFLALGSVVITLAGAVALSAISASQGEIAEGLQLKSLAIL